MSRWRLQERDRLPVAFWTLNRKLNPRLIWTHAIDGSQPSTSTSPRRLPWWRSRFVSALLVWVIRRHSKRRNPCSDACYVAIRFPPQRRSLSRPHTPCVRLERALEGLRKSPLTVDSHTAAGLVVPVAT
ncbi:hypothetical protein Taro_014939 [Colocasia esculenta]|uniref:Uncharacterized protein n=1 Tax=Colocasia esculenta TaxID=4460 RepID=A0A843UFZ9_COLES|nr:hypothetical protein [Colocasia esculenta]